MRALHSTSRHTPQGLNEYPAAAGYALLLAALVGMLALTWNLYRFAGARSPSVLCIQILLFPSHWPASARSLDAAPTGRRLLPCALAATPRQFLTHLWEYALWVQKGGLAGAKGGAWDYAPGSSSCECTYEGRCGASVCDESEFLHQ